MKASVFDLQMDPAGNGLQLHRIDKSKDTNFWSVRVNRDVRLIIHKTGDSLLVAYVDHHDAAYAWAERRRIEAHPRTGAIQIVEVRERVEEIAPPPTLDLVLPQPAADRKADTPALFASLNDDALLGIGVPGDWLADVRAANEESFFGLVQHLPAEASEALLEFAATGRLAVPEPASTVDPFAHPDALRRIRPIADQEELEQALAYPWEKWGVFLHPSQRALAERSFSGPARVAGSAGTGKTVVALHRAVRLARQDPAGRVLLASFSQPLADAMAKKLLVLAPETGGVVPRITTASFVDAWGLASLEAYQGVQRMGRKSRLGPNQRARLWPVFQAVRTALAAERIISVFHGPPPDVQRLPTVEAEAEAVRLAVAAWLGDGVQPHEIGLFVRTSQLIARARGAIQGLSGADTMTTAPMCLAKGLEFRAVVVMACDEGTLPLDERVADAADEAELDEIYETERRLLYVACTRARDHLLLTGVAPASEYLADFGE